MNNPHCVLLIANLLVEYIGYTRFQTLAKQSSAVIRVVILQDFAEGFVSNSPDFPSFAALNTIHEQLQEVELTRSMLSIDYSLSKRTLSPLPNGKALLRLDYMYGLSIDEVNATIRSL